MLGAVGKVLGQPFDERELAAQVALGVGQPAGALLDQSQAVARLGQRFAVARHRGEFGDQLVEEVEGTAIIGLCLRQIAQLAVDPSARFDRQGQLIAGLGVLGVCGVGPLKLGDSLVVDRSGPGELAVEPHQVAPALQRLAQAEDILGGDAQGSLGAGEFTLDLYGLAIELFRPILVGPFANQEISQEGAGAGQRLLRLEPDARELRQGLEHLGGPLIGGLGFLQTTQFAAGCRPFAGRRGHAPGARRGRGMSGS